MLNPDAVDFFIQTTHEEYYRHFGDRFGKLIKGIFTDEPSFGYGISFIEPASKELQIAWYPELEEEYKALTGRDLKDDIRSHLDGTAPMFFLKGYHELLGKRFRATFFDKVRAWCDSHGILLTGHLMCESSIHALHFNGDPLLAIDGFSMPGMDEIYTHTTLDKIEWQTLGTARYGIEKHGNGGLVELFALGPSHMPALKYRQMFWLVAMFGMDHYVLAVSQFQSRGNIYKLEYYNPTTPAQTWFDHYAELGMDAARAASFATRPVLPEIEIRYPEYEPELPEMLKKLVAAQRPWRIIHRDDQSAVGTPAVLRFEQNGILEEDSGLRFDDIDAFIAWAETTLPRQATVTDAEGKRVKDVLTRCYADGNIVVLDLREHNAEPRILTLHSNGQTTMFVLWAGDNVVVGPDGITPGSSIHPFPESQEVEYGNWRLELDRQNLLCPEYDVERKLHLTVEEDVGEVTILLRRYGEHASATLDGKEIKVFTYPKVLPQGLNELYLETEPLRLSVGEHLIQLTGDATEYPYLPGVFIAGNFAVEATDAPHGRMTIRRLPDFMPQGDLTKKLLRNYAGRVILTKRCPIPEKAYAICLDTNNICAEVLIDGKSIGKKAWPPFIIPLPKDKPEDIVELSIVLYPPVFAIFGRERFTPKNVGYCMPTFDDSPVALLRADWLME